MSYTPFFIHVIAMKVLFLNIKTSNYRDEILLFYIPFCLLCNEQYLLFDRAFLFHTQMSSFLSPRVYTTLYWLFNRTPLLHTPFYSLLSELMLFHTILLIALMKPFYFTHHFIHFLQSHLFHTPFYSFKNKINWFVYSLTNL